MILLSTCKIVVHFRTCIANVKKIHLVPINFTSGLCKLDEL